MNIGSGPRPILIALVVIGWMVLLSGCGVPEVSQEQPASGWTQLPDSPLPPGRDGSVAFWAGDRLVVAGGADYGEPVGTAGEVMEVRPTGQTVSYVPSSNEWVEESPLVVPGYDGVVFAAGVWMGTYWLGVGSACQTAKGFGVLQGCTKNRVALSWELSTGWTVLPPAPAEAIAGTDPDREGETSELVPVGTSGDAALFASPTGFALLSRETGWSFTPWPSFQPAGLVGGGATCLMGNEIFVATNDDPLREAGGTTMETDTLFAVDVTSGVARTVWSGQTASYSPGAGLVCLPDAVLYQPAQTEAILAVSAIGVRELPLIEMPATAEISGLPLTLSNGMLVADARVVEFGVGPSQLSWYLDATGTPLFFPSALDFGPRVWAGGQIFVKLASDYDTPAAGQWFVLAFQPDSPGLDLTAAVFPIPTDTGSRLGG